MAEGESGARKKSTTKRTSRAKATSRAGSRAPTRGSSASTSEPNPFGLEQGDFKGGGDEPLHPPPETLDEDFEAAPPEPIEWTPERAGAVVRAGGFMLHSTDSVTREPGGEALWRATEADVDAIGAPLSRILNRYAPARQLAGLSDEGELAFGLVAYAKRNLALRGQVLADKRRREAELEAADTETPWRRPGEEPPPATS